MGNSFLRVLYLIGVGGGVVMTSNFESNSSYLAKPANAVKTLKRDQFELLSAYLDGEVTADERRQVEELLDRDPTVQRLYTRLLSLRQGLQQVPVPASPQSTQETIEQVFARVDRRPKRLLIWGGAAIAAMCVAAVSGIVSTQKSFVPQLAQTPQTQVSSDSLMIALNTPVVEIPKAAVANPEEKSVVAKALIVE
jgi:anti-sigma factor RsiW